MGCQDLNACNYDVSATDSGDCIFADDDNCECDNGSVLFQDSDGDGVCDFDEIEGCQEFDACNYNADATDPADCTYIDGICETCENGVIMIMILMMMGFVMNLEVPGCQDEDACNYNENATDSDDSCDYAEEYYDCDGVCFERIPMEMAFVMNMRCLVVKMKMPVTTTKMQQTRIIH